MRCVSVPGSSRRGSQELVGFSTLVEQAKEQVAGASLDAEFMVSCCAVVCLVAYLVLQVVVGSAPCFRVAPQGSATNHSLTLPLNLTTEWLALQTAVLVVAAATPTLEYFRQL